MIFLGFMLGFIVCMCLVFVATRTRHWTAEDWKRLWSWRERG
jgi:hypothetical protein